MRRLFRIILGVVTLVSVLACVATCVLWVRSSWVADGYFGMAGRAGVESDRGRFDVWWLSADPGKDVTSSSPDDGYGQRPVDSAVGAWIKEHELIFRFWYQRERGAMGWYTGFGVPHWFMVVVFGALPAARAAAWYRGRRGDRSGLCAVCGYDMRATPDRCPECGAGRASA